MTSAAPASREFRVFLSSTFRDMDQERDHLLTHVFPVFRAACLERLVTFTEIDLRWGVTEEDAKNGRTVEICLDEIERCRKVKPPPFFIGFLGERYGWIPAYDDLVQYWETRPDSPYAARIQMALDEGISVTELEMRVALMDPGGGEDVSRGRFFLRARSLTDKIAIDAGKEEGDPEFYDPAGDRLYKLKNVLRSTPFFGLDNYCSITEFGDAVMAYLMQQLNLFFPAAVTPTDQELLTAMHARYTQSRLYAYVPIPKIEQSVIDAWRAACLSPNAAPIIIKAPSGCGKSAFLAYLSSRFTGQNDAEVFLHYVGADGILTLEGWVDRLIAFLQGKGFLTTSIPSKDDERWQILPKLLAETVTGINKPFVLIIDALNQFSAPNETFLRLSNLILPQNVIILASVTPEIETLGMNTIQLPKFDVVTRKQAIARFLQSFRKQLSPKLISSIASKEACATPLYLRLLLEELRLHARFETIAAKTDELLKFPNVGDLFLHILQIMDQEDFGKQGHPEISLKAARYIAASWLGLYHADLAGLLAGKGDPRSPFNGKARLSDLILTPLLARFSSFCSYDNGRITLMHSALKHVFLDQNDKISTARRDLVTHFSDFQDVNSLAETLFQLKQINDYSSIAKNINSSNMINLWERYPSTLDESLSCLGAGAKINTEYMEVIIENSINFDNKLFLNNKISSFVAWLLSKNYLYLAISINTQVVNFFNDESDNIQLVRRSLALMISSQIFESLCMFDKAVNCSSQASVNLNVFFTDIPSLSGRSVMESGRLMLNRGAFQTSEYHLFISLRDFMRDITNSYMNVEKVLRFTAILYLNKNKNDDSEKIFSGLRIFWKKINRKESAIQNIEYLIDLNSFYRKTKRYNLSLSALQDAKKLIITENFYYSNINYITLTEMVISYLDINDTIMAEKTLLEVKVIADKIFYENHPLISKYYISLALLNQRRNNHSISEINFNKAIEILEYSLPWNSIERAEVLLLRSKLFQEIGSDNDYISSLRTVYGIVKNSLYGTHPLFIEVLYLIKKYYEEKSEKFLLDLFIEEEKNRLDSLIFPDFRGPFPPENAEDILKNTNVIALSLKAIITLP